MDIQGDNFHESYIFHTTVMDAEGMFLGKGGGSVIVFYLHHPPALQGACGFYLYSVAVSWTQDFFFCCFAVPMFTHSYLTNNLLIIRAHQRKYCLDWTAVQREAQS